MELGGLFEFNDINIFYKDQYSKSSHIFAHYPSSLNRTKYVYLSQWSEQAIERATWSWDS